MHECSLCKLLNDITENDFVIKLSKTNVYKSPLADKWHGSMMVVSHRHVHEMTDLGGAAITLTQSDLFIVEKAVRQVFKPLRVNVVKFANSVNHLHWHFIPRYDNEYYLTKSPWELLDIPNEKLFKSFYIKDELLYDKFKFNLIDNTLKRNSGLYSSAFIFKHIDKNYEYKMLNEDILNIKLNLNNWEMLLMQRNYGDFAYDNIGGVLEAGELPLQALQREVYEETSFEIKEYVECGRQWYNGLLVGFIYIVKLNDNNIFDINNYSCQDNTEIKQYKFVKLTDILSKYSEYNKIRPRLQAFLNEEKDFVE